jgi:DNA-binding FadR family transcriptional regulator
MPLQSIEPRRLYRQIADQIRLLIGSGEYPTGARLPPERDLAKQLGVSRPSVREALIALEVEGLVDVRIGSGIYVRNEGARSGAGGVEHGASSGPFELLRARWSIEGETAALAAKSARRAQLASIEEAIALMEDAAARNEVPQEGDRQFHLRIAEASGNGVLVNVVKMLWEERAGPLFTQLENHFATPETWARAMAEHREVLAALRSRDAAAARAAMHRHLDQAYKRFSRGWSNGKED